MTREELRALLASTTNEDFVDRYVIAGTPWIFDTDRNYDDWLSSISSEIRLDPKYIRIVGSAATGYSLSPLKPGRPFRPQRIDVRASDMSDIDVALTDAKAFERAWDTIVSYDRQHRLPVPAVNRDRARVDVYWGLVGHRSIPTNTEIGRWMTTARAVIGRRPPLRGYQIRCRLYRRIDDLRSYHLSSLRQLRAELERVQ